MKRFTPTKVIEPLVLASLKITSVDDVIPETWMDASISKTLSEPVNCAMFVWVQVEPLQFAVVVSQFPAGSPAVQN